MKFEQVLELVNAVSHSNLTTFKYDDGDVNITMKTGETPTMVMASDVVAPKQAPVTYETVAPLKVEDPAEVQEATVTEGNVVTSPLVGTFYSAPSEEADVFVKVGDVVKKGQTLAIVEAMKLMNEIDSDFDGTVAEVLVGNGQAVEYGQSLFVIK